MTHATISVQDGVVQLECAKGTASRLVPSGRSSVLADWRLVQQAVSDLVLLAKPQQARLLLVIASNDPAECELIAADEIRQATRVAEVSWATATCADSFPVLRPKNPPVERPGWSLMGASIHAPAAELSIDRALLLLRWNGQKAAQRIPVHPRLIAPEFGAFADAMIRATRDLKIPRGTMVHLAVGQEQALSQLDKQVIAEGILDSGMETSIQWQEAQQRVKSASMGFGWVYGMVFAFSFSIAFVFALPIFPVEWIIGLGLVGVLGASAIAMWFEHRARLRRVAATLIPRSS